MHKIIKEHWLQLKKGTKTMFKEFFNKETNKKQRANMWTFSRLITSFLIPVFSVFSILSSNMALLVTSIGITGFGALTDFFDGKSARKHNSYSEYGRFLDQLADKVFSGMISINLSLFNPLFLIELLGEGIIVATNTLTKLKNEDLEIKSTQIGRIKQWPLFSSLVLGFISLGVPALNTVTNIFVILTFLLQLITALSYVKVNKENIKKLKNYNTNNLIEVEDNCEKDNEKVKTKSIESKNSNIIEENKTISRLEQCENLKKLKEQLINENNLDDGLNKKNHQKIKK